MHHFRKTMKTYKSHNKADKKVSDCTFCRPNTRARAVESTDTVFVIPNRVHYDMFEGRRVIDHLMVIPKAHRESVEEFTDQEKQDVMDIIGKYEVQGYHFYGRGVQTVTRSVKHQHTHLIKAESKWPRFFVYIRKFDYLVSK